MWSLLSLKKIWFWLLLSWFICGITATLAGFTGLFYPAASILLLFPIGLIVIGTLTALAKFQTFSKFEKITIGLLAIWWFLHSLQVFVPETGFDALWYHLPLAQQITTTHRFIGDTNFYQSFNPQFSDSIFYLGFAAAGETGTKIVAYFFGITLIVTAYILSRLFLNRTLSLLSVLLISSFQVVSWQSSSFYIDIAKAVWELSALIFILEEKKKPIFAGLAFGASLASKLFSILLLPVKVLVIWILSGNKSAVMFALCSLLVALPYYYFSHQSSGNAFYSAFHHVENISNTENSALNYILERTVLLPKAVVEMVLTREYTTPLIILFFPLIVILRKRIWNDKKLLALSIFSLYQFLIWWYLPPTSVRYALSGFITAAIFVIVSLTFLTKKNKSQNVLMWVLLIAGVIALPIRLNVARRSWQFLSGQQTKVEYLEQFYDGNVDTVLKKWHHVD